MDNFEKDWEGNEQEIEKIVKIIQEAIGGVDTYWATLIAIELLRYYQPKIYKDSVVLSREDYEKLQEKVVDLRYDKLDLKNEISEKDNKIKLLEETIECIKFNVDFTRKETAEKCIRLIKETYFTKEALCEFIAKQFGVEIKE